MSGSDDERPLSSKDFFKYMENMSKLLKEGVHSEVTAAIAPFRDKQNMIVEDLAETNEKVTELETDHLSTKTKVNELEKQIESLKYNLGPKPEKAFHSLPSYSATLQNYHHHQAPPSTLMYNQDNTDLTSAVEVARKVIGFSPITREDIEYLKNKLSMTDDFEAMKCSILDFLEFEMKVPMNNIVIKNVFPASPDHPVKNCLFAEFSDALVSDSIFSYVMNLCPGTNNDIYVPPCLRPRSKAVGKVAFDFRNAAVKHKTKIRYGISDFILSIKEKGQSGPSSIVTLDTNCLPPLDPSFSGSKSSPAPGRSRLLSKRTRPLSNTPPDERSSKSRKEDLTDIAISNNEPTPVKSPTATKADPNPIDEMVQTTPAKLDPSLASAKDLGTFQPSSFVSPSTTSNKNFTFTNSSIPIMKSLN